MLTITELCSVPDCKRRLTTDRCCPKHGNIFMKTDYGEPPEAVNHPQHYGGDTVYETIKVLKAWLTPEEYIGALKFNVVKYVSRAGKKSGALEDLKKAQWYLEQAITELKESKG